MSTESRASTLPRPLKTELRTTRDLTTPQRLLLQIMRDHQFGRVENLLVRAGQPILDRDLKVVRLARLGGGGSEPNVSHTDEFELKQAVHELLDELARIQNGTVVRLEFRHGLPFLLETTMAPTPDERPDGPGDVEKLADESELNR